MGAGRVTGGMEGAGRKIGSGNSDSGAGRNVDGSVFGVGRIVGFSGAGAGRKTGGSKSGSGAGRNVDGSILGAGRKPGSDAGVGRTGDGLGAD